MHISLLDLGHATDRAYGGLGIALERPQTTLRGRKASRLTLEGFESSDEAAVRAALMRLRGVLHTELHGEVGLVESPPSHVGLGSRTAVVLSTLTLILNLAGVEPNREVICTASNRGGTSSVGISAFFGLGGLLLDPGRIQIGGREFLPSSASGAPEEPVFASSVAFPSDWRILLLLPEGKRLCGAAEVSLFRDNTPLPSSEVRAAIAAARSFVAGVECTDIFRVAEAAHRIAGAGFKRVEIENQRREVSELVELLYRESGLPIGMSSVGPLVYAIFRDGTDDPVVLERIACRTATKILGSTGAESTIQM